MSIYQVLKLSMVYAVKRETDTFFKRATAEGFYKLLNWMGAEVVFIMQIID